MEALSMIYSQPSISEVKKLINQFLFTFKIYDVDANDMFYYGIFCAPETYANYRWDMIYDTEERLEIPPELYAPCTTSQSRTEYVKQIINSVLKYEIIKPEWMKFIEMESTCNHSNNQPSNFLRLLPKKEKYKSIGECLINFLYSPNRTTVVY